MCMYVLFAILAVVAAENIAQIKLKNIAEDCQPLLIINLRLFRLHKPVCDGVWYICGL